MTKRKSIALVVAILVIAGLAVGLKLSLAQDAPGQQPAEKPRAVAAVAAESITEYEPDPFEPERLRSSTVRVKRVAVVYSDGSVEIKPCQ
ncbi:MAG: hypothetical protein U9R79_07850 [Armatimonadota bacterium]|nr:hypothetical protein [Armatimonadota bacterium]